MKKAVVLVAALVLFTVLMTAETYEHKSGGISIWLPDDWSVDTQNGSISADAPDGDAFIILDLFENIDTLDAALEAYGDLMELFVEEYKATSEPEKTNIDGLEIYGLSGVGKVNGDDWNVDLMLISTGKAIVFCISANSLDSEGKYDDVYSQIAASLKAI